VENGIITTMTSSDGLSVRVIDATDPSAPIEVGSFPEIGSGGCIVSKDGLAYVVELVRLSVLDVSEPAHPVLLDRADLNRVPGQPAQYFEVLVDGPHVYVSGSATTDRYSFDETNGLRYLDSELAPGSTYGIDMDESGRLFTVGRVNVQPLPYAILSAVDPGDPPIRVGSIAPDHASLSFLIHQQLELDGTTLYYALDDQLLHVYDVTVPSEPVLIGELEEPIDRVDRMARSGELLVISGQSTNMRVIDITNPAAMRVLSEIGGGFTSFATRDGLLARGSEDPGDGSIRLLDISEPEAPGQVAEILTQSVPWGVALLDRDLLVGVGAAGLLEVFDISSPGSPAPIGQITLPGAIEEGVGGLIESRISLDYQESVLSVYSEDLILWSVDLSEPDSPELLSTFSVGEFPASTIFSFPLDRAGSVLAASDSSATLRLFEVSDPTSPTIVGSVPMVFPSALAIGSGVVITTDVYLGEAEIFDLRGCLAPDCSKEADIALPLGVMDFNDVLAFLERFAQGSPITDIAAPFGVHNFNDVLTFLTAFSQGCP